MADKSGQSPHPLFYRQPELLQAERHHDLALSETVSYGFAAEVVSLPLNAVEVPVAARDYPVVFTSDRTMLLALVGLRAGENLFVRPDGSWEPGCYIPAYVRRYPFALVGRGEADQFSLCVDMASERVVRGDGPKLFEDGKPSQLTSDALQFCAAFERELGATRGVMQALKDKALLKPNEATIRLAEGQQISMTDFTVVDEARFQSLSDEDFLALRAAGALPAVYGHLASQPSWSDLMRRLGERKAAGR
jgi:hypothetical protein